MHRLLLALACTLALAGRASADPRVYLITDLELMDPHAYASIPLFGCNDVTNTVLLGLAPSVNDQIATSLTTDGDNDGYLDLSPMIAALNAGNAATGLGPDTELEWNIGDPGGELAFHFATCSSPQASATCEQDAAMPVEYSQFQNAVGGTCLAPRSGVTGGFSPPIVSPVAPCFVSDPFRLSMDVAGLKLQLEDSRIAATYVGDPATDLVDGLIYGFLSEAAADTILISPSVAFVGGQPISSILPGGATCCSSRDDRDLGEDGVTLGWWLHFNFVATEVAWVPTGAPVPLAPVGSGLRLDAAAPNPFRGGTSLSYFLPRDGAVRARVHDVAGRLVASLGDGERPAGRNTVSWDGRASDGSAAGPGIYFVRLEWNGESVTRRVVRLR